VRRFFVEECTDHVRVLLRREIDSRTAGVRRFTFNVFDVVLDFNVGTVTIEDVLKPNSAASLSLADFSRMLSGESAGHA